MNILLKEQLVEIFTNLMKEKKEHLKYERKKEATEIKHCF